MIYYILNPFENTFEKFDSTKESNAQELCQNKLLEYQTAYLNQEKLRFHFVKVVAANAGEIWVDADLANDPEVGDYRVFSQYLGTYDSFASLQAAKADFVSKQQEFLTSIGLDKVRIEKEFIAEPTTTVAAVGTESGLTNG